MSKRNNKLYCENERIVAIQKAALDKNEIAIFDDGLQQKSLSYDISFVCFNIQNWIGNGFLLPAGPLRESLSSLKNYTAVILTGNNENTRHIKSQIKNYNSKIKIFLKIKSNSGKSLKKSALPHLQAKSCPPTILIFTN